MTMFTWRPFYEELATRILEYRDRQDELLAILRKADADGLPTIRLTDVGPGDSEVDRAEIDPFTFFANFNRGITDANRIRITQIIKTELRIAANAPTDFHGIPIVDNQQSIFVAWAKDRNQEDIPILWEIAKILVEKGISAIPDDLFKRCLEIKTVALTKLTMGFFWLRPSECFALDGNNMALLQKEGILARKKDIKSIGDYLNVIEKVKERLGSDFAAISHGAWVLDEGKEEEDADDVVTTQGVNYWTIAPGEKAHLWEQWQKEGIIAIGWDELGDLTAYPDKEAIRARIRNISGKEDSSFKNDVVACHQFAKVMKPGDIVFAKKGLKTLLGRGVVESAYEFDSARDGYQHIRKVKWARMGEWPVPDAGRVALKTLTCVTRYRDFVESLERVLCEESDPPVEMEVEIERYDSEKARRGLFMPETQFDEMLLSLTERKNVILQGAPGVGKTFVARRLAYALVGSNDPARIETIQFHQSYSYEDFIQGFRPTAAGQFALRYGIFHQFCIRAQRDEAAGKPYAFIIDEINRGNLSKIFGELMMLIEADKRGAEFAMSLTYSDGDRFYIPANVHLIGMMNTADRSLAMVDYALRRRFRFITLRPEFGSADFRKHLLERGAPESLVRRIVDRMTVLNGVIAADTRNLGPGYQVGHSYFCPADGATPDEAWYRRVVENEVLPLIQEYWFDNEEKVKEHRGNLLA